MASVNLPAPKYPQKINKWDSFKKSLNTSFGNLVNTRRGRGPGLDQASQWAIGSMPGSKNIRNYLQTPIIQSPSPNVAPVTRASRITNFTGLNKPLSPAGQKRADVTMGGLTGIGQGAGVLGSYNAIGNIMLGQRGQGLKNYQPNTTGGKVAQIGGQIVGAGIASQMANPLGNKLVSSLVIKNPLTRALASEAAESLAVWTPSRVVDNMAFNNKSFRQSMQEIPGQTAYDIAGGVLGRGVTNAAGTIGKKLAGPGVRKVVESLDKLRSKETSVSRQSPELAKVINEKYARLADMFDGIKARGKNYLKVTGSDGVSVKQMMDTDAQDIIKNAQSELEPKVYREAIKGAKTKWEKALNLAPYLFEDVPGSAKRPKGDMLFSSAIGSGYGLERDENGNWQYNTEKGLKGALAGSAVMGGINTKVGKQTLGKLLTKSSKILDEMGLNKLQSKFESEKLMGKPMQGTKGLMSDIEGGKKQLETLTPELKPQAATEIPQTSLATQPQSGAIQNIRMQNALGSATETQTPPIGRLPLSAEGGKILPNPPQSATPSTSNVPEESNIINSIKSKVNKLYTQAVDRFHPLSQISKQAGQERAMQNALTGHYGAGSTATYHIDYELGPILREQNIDNLKRAAIAMRDVELQNRGIKGSPESKTAVDNLNALKSELGDSQMQSLGETLKKLYAYQDKMVQDYLVNTGVISESAYKSMRKNNQFYVPYKRVMDTVDEFLGFTPQTRGAGSVSSQNVIKGIKGSDKEILDPIESIVENTYKMVGLGKRQEVAQTIVSLQDKLPKGMVQKLSKVDKHSPNETISLFVNGKVQHYKVPTEVAEAARGLSEEQMSTIIKILQAPTQIFRATATVINPEFMLPNVARDWQSAFVNVGLNPLNWVRGVAHLFKEDGLYQEFLKAGGQTSRVSIDQPMLKKTVRQIANPKGISIKKPSDLLKILQSAGEYSEQPTRIAAFESELNKLVKQGMPREEALKQAAYAAQEGTVNFARRGSKTQSANAIYAFMNARLQGTDRLIRSIKKDPAGASIRLGLMALAPALAVRTHNSQFQSYNDDRIISERDKRDNYIFMLSDTPIESLRGAQYIKIPKGDVGKLSNPVDAFLDFAQGKGGNIVKVLGETLKSFAPIDEPGGLIPTAVKPIVEVSANKNFYTGYDIVPQYKKNYPAGQQSSPYTSPMFRMLGEKTNMSPAKMQHLAEGYGTGLMRIGEMTTQPFIDDKYVTPQNERGATVNRSPILRRVFGGAKMSEEEKAKSNADTNEYLNKEMNKLRKEVLLGNLTQDQSDKQINKLQGQIKGITPVSTGKIFRYIRQSDGSMQSIDTTKIKAGSDEAYEKARDIYKNDDLTEDEKQKITGTLGIQGNKFNYFQVANLEPDDKIRYLVKAGLANNPKALMKLHNRVAGKSILTTTVINDLARLGYFDDNTAKVLNSVKYDPVNNRLYIQKSKPKKVGTAKIKTALSAYQKNIERANLSLKGARSLSDTFARQRSKYGKM